MADEAEEALAGQRSAALDALADELGAANARAAELELPEVSIPDGLTERRDTLERLRSAIGVVVAERTEAAQKAVQASIDALTTAGLPTEAVAALLEKVEQSDTPAGAQEAAAQARSLAHEALAAAAAEVVGRWKELAPDGKALGLDMAAAPTDVEALVADPAALVTAREGAEGLATRIGDERSARLEAARARCRAARERAASLALTVKGLDGKDPKGDDVAAWEERADALERSVAAAEETATQDLRTRHGKLAEAAKAVGVEVTDLPTELVELRAAVDALAVAVEGGRTQQLEQARSRVVDAMEALEALPDASAHRAALEAALGKAESTEDHVVAIAAAEEAEAALEAARAQALEAARSAWEAAATSAKALDLDVDEAPAALEQLLDATESLEEQATEARAARCKEARARIDVAIDGLAALPSDGAAPHREAAEAARAKAADTDDHQVATTAAEAAEAALTAARSEAMATARSAWSDAEAAAMSLDLEPPTAPEELDALIVGTSKLAAEVEKVRARRLDAARARVRAVRDTLEALDGAPEGPVEAAKAAEKAAEADDVAAAEAAAVAAEAALLEAQEGALAAALEAHRRLAEQAVALELPVDPLADDAGREAVQEATAALQAKVDRTVRERRAALRERIASAIERLGALPEPQTAEAPELPRNLEEAEANVVALETRADAAEAAALDTVLTRARGLLAELGDLGETPSVDLATPPPTVSAALAAVGVLEAQLAAATEARVAELRAGLKGLSVRAEAVGAPVEPVDDDATVPQLAVALEARTAAVEQAEAQALADALAAQEPLRTEAEALGLSVPEPAERLDAVRAQTEALGKQVADAQAARAKAEAEELAELRARFESLSASMGAMNLQAPAAPGDDALDAWRSAVSSAEGDLEQEQTSRQAAVAATFAMLHGVATRLGLEVDVDEQPSAEGNQGLEERLRAEAVARIASFDAEARTHAPDLPELDPPHELDDLLDALAAAEQRVVTARTGRLVRARDALDAVVHNSGLAAPEHDGDDPAAVEQAHVALLAVWASVRLEEVHTSVQATAALAAERGIDREVPPVPSSASHEELDALEAAAKAFEDDIRSAALAAAREALDVVLADARERGVEPDLPQIGDDLGSLDIAVGVVRDQVLAARRQSLQRRRDGLEALATSHEVEPPALTDDVDVDEAALAAFAVQLTGLRRERADERATSLRELAEARGLSVDVPSLPQEVTDESLAELEAALDDAAGALRRARLGKAREEARHLRTLDGSLELPDGDDPDRWEAFVATEGPRIEAELQDSAKGRATHLLESILAIEPGAQLVAVEDGGPPVDPETMRETIATADRSALDHLADALEARHDAVAKVALAEAVAIVEALVRRTEAAGDPRDIEAARSVLQQVRATADVAEARALAAGGPAAVAADRRERLQDEIRAHRGALEALDAKLPALEPLYAPMTAAGPESTKAVDAWQATDPRPAVQSARAAVDAASEASEAADDQAVFALEEAQRQLEAAEHAVAQAQAKGKPLRDAARAALRVEQVMTLRDGIAEHIGVDGVEPLLRAAESALRSARTARARGDLEGLEAAWNATKVSSERAERLARAASEAIAAPEAAAPPEPPTAPEPTAEPAPEPVPETAAEPVAAPVDLETLTIDLRSMVLEGRIRAGDDDAHRAALEVLEEQSLLGTLTLDVGEAQTAWRLAREALDALPEAPHSEPEPEPEPEGRVRQLRRGRQAEGETAVDRLRQGRRRRDPNRTQVDVDATRPMSAADRDTPSTMPRRDHDEIPIPNDFEDDEDLFEEDSVEADLNTVVYDDDMFGTAEPTHDSVLLDDDASDAGVVHAHDGVVPPERPSSGYRPEELTAIDSDPVLVERVHHDDAYVAPPEAAGATAAASDVFVREEDSDEPVIEITAEEPLPDEIEVDITMDEPVVVDDGPPDHGEAFVMVDEGPQDDGDAFVMVDEPPASEVVVVDDDAKDDGDAFVMVDDEAPYTGDGPLVSFDAPPPAAEPPPAPEPASPPPANDSYVVFEEPEPRGAGSTLTPVDDEEDDDPFHVVVEERGSAIPASDPAPGRAEGTPSRPPIAVESMADIFDVFEQMEKERAAAEAAKAVAAEEALPAPDDEVLEAPPELDDDDDDDHHEPELPEFPDITSGDDHPGTDDVEEAFERTGDHDFGTDDADRDPTTLDTGGPPPPPVQPIDLGSLAGAHRTNTTLEVPPDDEEDDDDPDSVFPMDSPRVPHTPPPASRTMILMDDDDEDDDDEALATQRIALGQPPSSDPQATVLFQRPAPPKKKKKPAPPPVVSSRTTSEPDDEDGTETKKLSVNSLRERLLARKRGASKTPSSEPAPPKPPAKKKARPEPYDPNARTVILTPEQLRQMAMEEDFDDDEEDDGDPPSESGNKTTLFSKEDLAAEFDFAADFDDDDDDE